ncbi:MAG: RNA methyltransferase [Polyangiales bacterium]
MSAVYCALVHHPVVDRAGAEVTTSVTNLDVHDIARSARTYGVRGYFVVSPIDAQYPVVQRILDHWRDGKGKQRVPERSEALSIVEIAASVDAAISRIEAREGKSPKLLVTSARPGPNRTAFATEAARLAADPDPALILFGTGHGLAPPILSRADVILAPIEGPTDYNHLSVRAAAAITLDRLFGV